jgi:hypothetical protein
MRILTKRDGGAMVVCEAQIDRVLSLKSGGALILHSFAKACNAG